jgi:TonB family protein
LRYSPELFKQTPSAGKPVCYGFGISLFSRLCGRGKQHCCLGAMTRQIHRGVNAASKYPAAGLWILCLALTARPAGAQHVLLAQEDGKLFLVCGANENRPYVQKEGKVVSVDPHGFALREVSEFAPYFVTVSDVNVQATYATGSSSSAQLNNDFHFNAELETEYRLADVFIVMSLETDRLGKSLFLWGVGTLEPHEKKEISVVVPMDAPLGSGHYQFRLFSGGAELLQSLLPIGEDETALNRMVATRIKDVQDAPPKFFFGPKPMYPKQLVKTNLKGRAVITVRIGANGAVFDPAVKSASDPAFGEAALRAVRLWRFLPMMKGGYAMETKADIPIVFDEPHPPAHNS